MGQPQGYRTGKLREELTSNKSMDAKQKMFSPTYTPPIVYHRPIASNNYAEADADHPAMVITAENYYKANETNIKDVWLQQNMTVAKMQTLEETIIQLEEKLNSLTETVAQLLENLDIGKHLRLVGNFTERTNPIEKVRHFIVDKLKLVDLGTTIVQAEYDTYGISFEVSSSSDKLRILKRYKDSLLSYEITDPPKIIFRINN